MNGRLLLVPVLLAGCAKLEDKPLDLVALCGGDLGSASTADMVTTTPVAKCAAAKGLSGDNLLCVDFDKIASLTDAALTGWKFDANMAGCWQISGGYLQVQNFGSFVGNCGLTLLPIDFKVAANQSYQRATIAIVHRVDMNDADQKAQVFIDLDDPARLIHQTTGKPGVPTLTTTTLTINKVDLPGAVNSVYKFFLKAGSLGTYSTRQGWQIQSIAVNGIP